MSNVIQTALANAIQQFGENYDLIRSGTTLPRRAIIAPMDNSTAGVYFDSNEQVGLEKPAQVLYSVDVSDPPVSGDVYSRDGRLWTVRKTYFTRVNDVVVMILCLCD